LKFFDTWNINDFLIFFSKSKNKDTPLHHAAMLKKYDIIELLINCGADIDAVNATGKTALMLAAIVGDEELIDFLLDYGANKHVRDTAKCSAYDYALKSKNPKSSDLFKQDRPVKPNPDKLARAKQTAVMQKSADESTSDGGQKKFDNIFAGGSGGGAGNKPSAQQPEKKYTGGGGESANTSRITEDNKLDATKSKISDKIDSWMSSDDDDEDEEEEDEDDEVGKRATPRAKAVKKDSFEAIFANASFQNKSLATNKSILKSSNFEPGNKPNQIFEFKFFILLFF
jgi:hypothetical protein